MILRYCIFGLVSFFVLFVLHSCSIESSSINNTVPELEYLNYHGKKVVVQSKYKNRFVNKKDSLAIKSSKVDSTDTKISETCEPLKRKIVKRANYISLVSDNRVELSFDICVDRTGEIMFAILRSVKGANDNQYIRSCQKKLFETKFSPVNDDEPQIECGTYTIKIIPSNFK